MHTNYDVIGMADLSAEHLKLQDTRVLTVTDGSGEQPEGSEEWESFPML